MNINLFTFNSIGISVYGTQNHNWQQNYLNTLSLLYGYAYNIEVFKINKYNKQKIVVFWQITISNKLFLLIFIVMKNTN